MTHPDNPPSPDDEEIFEIARSISDPSVREKYLQGVAGNDPQRLEHLNNMLNAQDESDSLFDWSADLGETVDQPVNATVGDQVGPYKLLQQIGEGGFGAVFMAEQIEPVRRKVALKMIKPGMDSKEITARFEAERQALALMNHPNIAKVLDAGTTPLGYPYFVMELVKGVSITQYADQNRLNTEERLQLFIDICRAVQHAHHKGVIHRDIKPSNVMVTLHDGKPVPKVIDFGVAKALSQPLTEKTLFTRYGQTIGTVLYMSPEQAEMSGLEIDTRGDVYSLGVVLYELLTGRTPFTADELRSAGLEEMRRLIRETDPAKPSKALRTLDNDTATTVASHRSCKPESLAKTVRGELDGIVMKCLEKDRNRRYDSPNALADDITRHLNNEPVNIPTSYSYQLLKAYRRNRIVCLTGAAVFASLLIGFVGALIALGEARRQTEVARNHEQEANRLKRELETTVTQLDELLHEQALEAALSGDQSLFQSAIERLKTINGNNPQILHLQALFDLSGGVRSDSLAELEDALAKGEVNCATLSILHIASERLLLDFDLMSTIRPRLETCNPENEFEQFLKTIALTDRELFEYHRFLSTKHDWSIGRALLANAQVEYFLETKDAKSLHSAWENIQFAISRAPENLLIRSILLEVMTQILIRPGVFEDQTQATIRSRANELATELGSEESTYVYGIYVAADYWSSIQDFERAIPIWYRLIEEFDAKSARWLYNPILLLAGQPTELPPAKMDPLYYFYHDDAETALEICRNSEWAEGLIGQVWKPMLFRILGEENEAIESLQLIRSNGLQDGYAYWISNLAKLVLGEMSEAEVVADADGDDEQLALAYMSLAFYVLSEDVNRRHEAVDYLQRAIELDIRPDDVAFWSLAFSRKLADDPDWPMSLRGTRDHQ